MNKEQTLSRLRDLNGSGTLVHQLVRLFDQGDAGIVHDDPEAHAVHAQVVLEGGYGTAGLLSLQEDGTLRMTQPGMVKDPEVVSRPPRPIMAEHYFEARRIVALIVVRQLKESATPRPIIITQ